MDSTDGEFRSGPQKTEQELPAFKLKTGDVIKIDCTTGDAELLIIGSERF